MLQNTEAMILFSCFRENDTLKLIGPLPYSREKNRIHDGFNFAEEKCKSQTYNSEIKIIM